AQRIDHASDDRIADRRFEHAPGGFDGVAFLDLQIIAEDDGADGIFFEVEDLSHRAAFELEQLPGHRALQAVDARDPVADFDDSADFANREPLLDVGDLALQNAGNF